MQFIINYVAVVIAAVASFLFGMLWYSPMLFGKQWMKQTGKTAKEFEKQKKKSPMPLYLAITFIGGLLTASMLNVLMINLGIFTMMDALLLAAIMWAGFVMVEETGMVLWEGKPAQVFWMKTAHSLLSLLLMAAILSGLQ